MESDIPYELREFYKVFERLCYMHDAADIFDTFLEWIMWGFCADGSLNWDCAKKYKEEEKKLFPELFKELTLVMRKQINIHGWYDPFGTYYEVYIAGKSRRDSRGQFFTPSHICDLMVRVNHKEDLSKKRGLVGDPTCGSGRTLLSFHAHVGPGNYFCAEDIDKTCCMMTVCNFLIHGCDGEVIWHDSMQPDSWFYGWRVNRNLNNPFHKHNGIPHVESLTKEESKVYQSWQHRQSENQKKEEKPVVEPIPIIQVPQYTQQTLF